MSQFTMTVPHHLSQEEALKRIQNLLGEAKKEYGDMINNLVETWSGNTGQFSFTLMGFDVSGKLVVNEADIAIEASLPFAASLFKDKIKKLISDKAAELLG
jgi:hypothetical protein